MKVQILGTGCPNCKVLTQNAIDAAAELNIVADIEKVEDIQEIVKMGIMRTPALAIDGQVKSSGRVLTVAQIKDLLKE
jgi:small redox-active disulfide protein 2